MNKAIRNVLSTLAVFTVFALPASADFTVRYPGGSGSFRISGETEIKKAGQSVIIKVENETSLLYTRRTATDAEGKYEFEFAFDEYGDAKVTVSENGVLKKTNIYKSTEAEKKNALGRLNSSEDKGKVVAEEYKVLQINADEFAEYNKKGIISEYLTGGRFESIEEFKKSYNKGMLLAAIEKESAAEELYSRLDEADMKLESKNAAEIFGAYDKEEKMRVLEMIRGKACKSDKEFSEALLGAVVMNEISKTENINEKYAAAEKNNDVLELDISKYKTLNADFDKFKTEVFGKSYTTVGELKKSCEEIYTRLSAPADMSGGSGGSGGGGGRKQNYGVSRDVLPQQPAEQTVFDDIESCKWAQEAIFSLINDGVISGKGNGKFAPNDNVTRAEFAKMAVIAFNIPYENAETTFSDTVKTSWEYKYVAAAAQSGIVKGKNGNIFGGGENITRQDIAVICERILKLSGTEIAAEGSAVFEDADEISEYAKNSVAALGAEGILNGKGDGKFCPKHYATRAEAVKIIYELRRRQK